MDLQLVKIILEVPFHTTVDFQLQCKHNLPQSWRKTCVIHPSTTASKQEKWGSDCIHVKPLTYLCWDESIYLDQPNEMPN